ncbi:MAG: HAD family hydrolase [Gemmataceae bacterium]
MRVCLFDIDGTILNSMGAGKAAIEAALLEEFEIPEIRVQVTYSGRTDRSIGLELLRTHGVEPNLENLQKLHAGYLERLPDSLARQQGLILPGIQELLERLAGQEHAELGLLTGNVRVGAKTKLGHFGLDDFFTFGGFGDHHEDRDDVAREALDQVRTHLGDHIELENIWVIGDTPLDVKCARAIGVNVVAVATGLHTREELQNHNPDLVLDDLSDSSPFFALWK